MMTTPTHPGARSPAQLLHRAAIQAATAAVALAAIAAAMFATIILL